jgi:hypothetical protein
MTPGKTTWDEAESAFENIASEIISQVINGEIAGAIYFYNPPDDISWSYISVNFTTRDQIIQSIFIHGLKIAPAYLLPNLLAEYGAPGEIWVHTYGVYPDDRPNSNVILSYPDEGILAHYTKHGEFVESDIKICIETAPAIGVWYPSKTMSFVQIQEMLGYDVSEELSYLPIAEATSMSVDEFYAEFRDEQDEVCFNTPKSLWPGPFGETPSP